MRDVAEILDHWQHGRSIQAISASLGLDRKTVRKYVGLAEQAGFSPGQRPSGGWGAWLDQRHPELNARGRVRPTVEHLDPLREEIRQALEGGVTPTTAWRRLHQAGRTAASLATFRRYVARTFPATGERSQIVVRRPEPLPGDEAQVDYGLLGMWLDPLTGAKRAVNAFALVLPMSRHQYACPVLHMDQQTWNDCHIAAFHFFGGVPHRIVPDNLKTGVLKPDLYDPAMSRAYEELAANGAGETSCDQADDASARTPVARPRGGSATPRQYRHCPADHREWRRCTCARHARRAISENSGVRIASGRVVALGLVGSVPTAMSPSRWRTCCRPGKAVRSHSPNAGGDFGVAKLGPFHVARWGRSRDP